MAGGFGPPPGVKDPKKEGLPKVELFEYKGRFGCKITADNMVTYSVDDYPNQTAAVQAAVRGLLRGMAMNIHLLEPYHPDKKIDRRDGRRVA